MSKLRASFIIFTDLLLVSALISIYYLDQMVNGTLYNYGLIFDSGWSQSYYLLSRLAVALVIAAIVITSSVELPISAFKEKRKKSQ